jgi:peroxiredoxin/glutaredoxin
MNLKDKTGELVPDVVFKVMENGNWKDVSTDDIFKGKTVIVHSLPGAATPTCSTSHLPRYDELSTSFQKNGVDDIICISVNDTFVMNAWKKELGIKNVKMLPDGNGEFTEKMGMLVDKSDLGFGMRSWRYSMIVKDKVIEKMFIEPNEPGDPFKVSDADTMLCHINPHCSLPMAYTIVTREGCPFCAKAKDLLESNDINYKEVKRESGVDAIALRGLTGKKTYPQLFVEGELIGGYEEMLKYFNQ